MRKYAFFTTLAASLMLIGAGCITFGPPTAAGGDGGIFKSTDKGDSWAQKVAIATTGGDTKSIGGVSVASILQDPSDSKALYIGSTENGMFYTYDGGESWKQPVQLSRGRVPSVAVSPDNKCVVYAATANKVLKSVDCSRTWEVPYVDSRTEREVTVVVVDHFNPNIVWIGNDLGEVLRSTDAGASWQPVTALKSKVMRIAMRNDDSRKLYVATEKRGIWRTSDGGGTWVDLSKNGEEGSGIAGYSEYSSSRDFYDIALGVSDPGFVVFASKYGLLRSNDGGDTWEEIPLLTPPGSTVIYSLAVDPKDANNIYYGTSTTYYRSPNGGTNWVPKNLPTSRVATVLLVDNASPSVLYMGVTKFKK